MKRLLLVLLLSCLQTAFAQKNILIYTHNGKGYKHENIPASVEALKKLCKDLGYEAESTDDPAIFTPDKMKTFACIIFSNTNNEAFDTEFQKQAFVDYTRRGGAFVGIHSASGSERQWPWFAAMLGGRFVRHPELQKFTIKVIEKRHPATEFLSDSWEWEDECYYLNQLNPDIHVLLAADLTTVKDDKRSEYPGVTFGDYFPLAWCHTYDGGRQFYTALGHKAEYYRDPTFLKHLSGGIKWALGKE
ncbi:MAG TPA: ThuA domain-containing protein [Cyclobacteriaceae bacterium]|nr:ThuA domain-containing protein [Cyclobacteriaceae bacterium]